MSNPPAMGALARWLSSILSGCLVVLSLSGCELSAPSLVIPLVLAAVLTGLEPDWRRASLAAAVVWLLALAILLRPAVEPPMIHLGDRNLLQIAAGHFQSHWTTTAVALSILWLAAGLGLCVLVRRHRAGLVPWLALALLAACFFVNALRFAPQQLADRASRPNPGYSFDGYLWMNTYYLIRDGQSFYPAFLEAFAQDRRAANSRPVFRSPVLYQVWGTLLPDGSAVVKAYLALSVLAMIAAYGLALGAGGKEASLLAPVLLFPYFIYGVYGFYFPFVELWVSALMLIAFGLYASGRRELGMAVALFAFVSRELALMLFASLSLDYLVENRRDRKKIVFLAVLWTVAVVFYLVHRSVVFQMVGDQGEFSRFFRPGWVHSLWAALSFGFLLFPLRSGVLLVCALLGAAGAALAARARVALCAALASSTLFLMLFSHGGRVIDGRVVWMPDYWGSLLAPFLLALVPVTLARFGTLGTAPEATPGEGGPVER
ncbi:MAG: hypothetical protein HY319_25090 [Armatimonadetes bacterium]|nr:hypothetical protein [Armatimonadota bacterium]